MKTPIFIKIDGDIFNVSNIQALSYEDKKNELGNDRGVCAYPHLAGVGSRATSSRTTTTHPALRWAPYLEQ